MPKALSLKKTLGSQVKNQKAITQFFKSCSQEKISPVKQQDSETIATTKTSKRKADSPAQIVHDNIRKDLTKCDNSVKKIKIDSNHRHEMHIGNTNTSQTPSSSAIKSSPRKDVTKKLFVDNEEELIHFNSQQKHPSSITNKTQDNHSSVSKVQSSPRKSNKSHEKENCYNHNCKEIDNNCVKNSSNEVHYRSPKKTLTAISVSPKSCTLTSQKCDDQSPSKSGSTAKVLECIENHMFDDWELDIEGDIKEDLDLSVIQRCEVLSVKRHNCKLELKLKNDNNNKGTCFIEGIWLNTPLEAGEIVSVLATRDTLGCYTINNTSGLLVLRPDHLVSSTSVVAGVFCKRKAVLQERWRGIDSANSAMTIGILVHELVQKSLTQNITNTSELGAEADKLIKESIQMLYDAGISETEARSNIQMYIQPLADFMQTYLASSAKSSQTVKRSWNGKIEKVLDIEENVCCPQLGLKGKIDATLQVSIHDRGDAKTAIVPLELKSGRASVSAEHRGQLVLYGMMLSLQRQQDPATALQRGLLLYLKERIDLREVSCGYPERRDLMMLRNELVQHLAAGPRTIDVDQIVDIEDASRLLQQSMPEPIHHQNACSKCPYLTLCSLHLWHTDGPMVSETHPLSKLRDEALGHLSPQHVKYFLHWTSLLKLEEKGQMITSPLHALWTESAEKRAKRGGCAVNLKLKSVISSGDRFAHIFVRESLSPEHSHIGDKPSKGPQEGEFSIVSIENRPWIAAGVVTVSNSNEFHILLERDLSRRLNEHTVFHIDTYESFATTVQNLTNLGVLMEDSDRALRLRTLIIDQAPPEFVPKLPREVGRLGSKLMRSLNIEQQRAVLKALACEHYVLLKGLPGTGKTQTISVLIQMLVGLKQRVLVTAHTHSAVDTVLNRLPKSVQVMRLGTASRVAPALLSRCEHTLIQKCHSTEQLAQLYDSMEVVGVTCLGAAHPMLARTTFDVCIVDEATQVLQSTVLRPLFAAKRFVLVGDPEQLPPVVRSRSARRLGMEESLFHRLIKDDVTCTLRLQYRMNQALVEVANKVAYNNSLKCADQKVAQAQLKIDMQKISLYSDESPWLMTACSPEFKDAAVFLNTIIPPAAKNNTEKVFTNSDEACVLLDLVETFKQGGVLPSDIGVIAPYRDQVSLLRRALSEKDVEVSTVDQFQGRDKSVIIYSCTKRVENDERRPKDGEVLNDQRRLAVSVTRAKHKLIVIGNLRALQRYAPLMKLIESCRTVTLEEDTVARLNIKYGAFVT
ncbi:DNA replication ATP-dependent helicase/nuclease DNA2 isoform X2 [Maniola jurtina]|uniref:DNA replication ATP-dependent helicase/nuclease DNA2 isoform X2 n=1 Tax=Maniola jurtina TaxID=191418 RepID=UPI001E6872B1|nr:DNA replication ATP-dependent helicase/nuclease DNA2 isoform X2 [Maniola jurtina]